MTDKERGLVPEREVNFKALRLITPKLARDLGIEAEGPVFVSPVMRTSQECDECGSLFTPLVYQAGYTVKAHHFHERSNGGIYHYHYPSLRAERQDFFYTSSWYGWFAALEPIGSISAGEFYQESRSQAVKVHSIRAWCQERHCLREMKEGVVVSADDNPDALLPLCNVERHPARASKVKFNFKITDDGSIVFSQISDRFNTLLA